jgi:hypothetical protein
MFPVSSPIGGRPPEVPVKREFELDDFCPILGQKSGGCGTEDHVREIQNADPFEDLGFFIGIGGVKKFGSKREIIFHSLSPQVGLFHKIALQ